MALKHTIVKAYYTRFGVYTQYTNSVFWSKKEKQLYALYHISLLFHRSLPPAETVGLLCSKGSDKWRRCWRRCVRNWPVTDLWLCVWTVMKSSFFLIQVRLHLHTLIAAHTPGHMLDTAALMFLQRAVSRLLRGNIFVPSSCPITVSTAFHPGYKKCRIRVEFFHQTPSRVKGQNIWVWSEHLGLLGTRRPWASDSHNILGHFIWFSLKSLYLQPHVHYCTNTRDATGLPKPHHSLPACNPQREREREKERGEGCFLENVWSDPRKWVVF